MVDVIYTPHSGYWLSRLLVFIRPSMRGAWVTLGRRVCHPEHVTNPEKHPAAKHENVHAEQQNKCGRLWPVWIFFYGCLPMPFLFAYFRWRWEREAYLVDILASHKPMAEVEIVVNSLWSWYFFTWPKSWMTAWFMEQLKRG